MILGHNKIHNEIKGECERERETDWLAYHSLSKNALYLHADSN